MAVSLMLATVLRAMGVKPRIVGDSAVMRRLLHVVACIGPKDITVLVGGERYGLVEIMANAAGGWPRGWH